MIIGNKINIVAQIYWRDITYANSTQSTIIYVEIWIIHRFFFSLCYSILPYQKQMYLMFFVVYYLLIFDDI